MVVLCGVELYYPSNIFIQPTSLLPPHSSKVTVDVDNIEVRDCTVSKGLMLLILKLLHRAPLAECVYRQYLLRLAPISLQADGTHLYNEK